MRCWTLSGQSGQTGERSGFRGTGCANLSKGCLQIPYATDSAFQRLLIRTFSVTTTIVTAVLIQPPAEFSRLPKNGIVNDSDLVLDNGEITNFKLLLSFFDQVS
jgi:hypothetical protein